MLTYNIGIINSKGERSETQIDIEERNRGDEEIVQIINTILCLKDEMDINEVSYIEYLADIDDEEEY